MKTFIVQSGGQFRHLINSRYMNETRHFLEQMGFTPHESRVYLDLLNLGETSASKLAAQLGLARTTTRNTLDRLYEEGLLNRIYRRNTQFYNCKPPSALVDLLKTREDLASKQLKKANQLLPNFMALYQSNAVVPKVRVFEGEKQVIEAFNHSLYAEVGEILFFTSYKFLQSQAIQKNDDEFYIPERIKKGIELRVLVGKTENASKMCKVNPSELRERRFIPDKFVLPGNIHVYGDFVVYFSTQNSETMAVLVESRIMAETMRTLFECIWESVGG